MPKKNCNNSQTESGVAKKKATKAVGATKSRKSPFGIVTASKAAAGAGVGADLFAGKHQTGTSAMIILGIGNFTFEYTLPLKKKKG